MQNARLASRVFRDAIAAIEGNGSATIYFRHVAEQEPVAFMKFLGHVLGKYLPHESGTDLEGARVYRSSAEIAEELRRRGLPVPTALDEDTHIIERERLIAEKQAGGSQAPRSTTSGCGHAGTDDATSAQ
jgi:hypothetical protein